MNEHEGTSELTLPGPGSPWWSFSLWASLFYGQLTTSGVIVVGRRGG